MSYILKIMTLNRTMKLLFALIKYDTENQRDDAFPGRSDTVCTGSCRQFAG